jgi:hypothetical protein
VVPRWVLGALLGVAVCALVGGFAAERTTWAASRPFTLNLLSSLASFSTSLVFVSLFLNRMVRRQYWSAELDRRTRAAMTIELARRDLGRFFDLVQRRPVIDQLHERRFMIDGPAGEPDEPEVLWITRPSSYSDLEKRVVELANLEQRLAFVADGELIYRCDRLSRKWSAFEIEADENANSTEPAEPSEELIGCGIELAEALDSLRKWILQAPDRRMRTAVEEQAFRSDLS